MLLGLVGVASKGEKVSPEREGTGEVGGGEGVEDGDINGAG